MVFLNTFLKISNYLCSKWAKLFLIGALCTGTLVGCASNVGEHTVRSYIPMTYGKEGLVKGNRFKLIDDFSSGDTTNRIGGRWKAEGPGAELEIVSEDAIKESGFALKVRYHLEEPGQVTISTDLNSLDISQADVFSLWFAYSAIQNPTISLTLVDGNGKSASYTIDKRLKRHSKQWQELFLPLRHWRKGLDFNHLSRLEIQIESEEGEDGSFLLDQISFFGARELFFESIKDNLVGFPKEEEVDRMPLKALSEEELLRRIAKDTWHYFRDILDKRHALPLDHIKLSLQRQVGDYTSPTNIGLYYISAIAAAKLGFISEKKAAALIGRSLTTVEELKKWNGFLFNYYSTTNLQVTNRFVSTVDNGWFAAGLMIVKATFPGKLGKRAQALLDGMDFGELYDVGEGKLFLGYDADAEKHSQYHYGMFITEARAASFIAIAKGDVEPEHWFRMHRALPKSWTWQNQVPQGEEAVYRDINVFSGYYMANDKKIVPSWGGSMFEFLMPMLVLKEKELAFKSLGSNNIRAAEIHRDFARVEKRYPVWGISPCMIDRGTRGAYLELGVNKIGAKGYRDAAVVTPHASILALELLPEDVLENIRRMINLYPIYGEYGLYDSVQLRKPQVTKQYLALDQGMILIAITNYLEQGYIREQFHSLPEVKEMESLLQEETFFV